MAAKKAPKPKTKQPTNPNKKPPTVPEPEPEKRPQRRTNDPNRFVWQPGDLTLADNE